MAPSGSGTPPSWGNMGWGVKIGWSRAQVASGPYFGAIFGHFEPFLALLGPFLTLFGQLGVGKRLQVGPDPLFSWGKMGWGVKIGGSRGPKWRPDPILVPFLAILSHFWPFWAFFDPFWPLGWGVTAPSGSGPL